VNWKLIFLLSLFGLFMAVATVYFIPSNIEPFCWLAIFLFCAYMIARNNTASRFLHGLCLGLANCVWITAAHVSLFNQYLAHHPQESSLLAQSPLPTHPRLMMAIGGPIVGIISGVIIGLLSLAAGKLTKSSSPATKAMGQSA
jgi:hypothetical protein